MTADFAAEFAHLRAAVSAEHPDWHEILFVSQLLTPYATAAHLQEALLGGITAGDQASLNVAANRLELLFGTDTGNAPVDSGAKM